MKWANTVKAVVPLGKDEVSFLHKRFTVRAQEDNHNPQVMNELMASTFSMRQQDITENPRSVQTLFEKYPFLNDVQQLMLEMSRIADDKEWNVKRETKWTDI
uniref:Uncharacterized protein n=1 Tax=Amphimedon queenslandica TaxID=400682 RepID=A0A1X7VY76_AMPQE